MKKLCLLLSMGFMSLSALAAEIQWKGSVNWRYDQTKLDDGLEAKNNTSGADVSKQTIKAQKIRAGLAASGEWENMTFGVGARTMSSANSNWVTFGTTDSNYGLEQAWMGYHREFGSLNLSVIAGKQKPVFLYDSNSESFLDNDVRFTGFGWNFNFGAFGLNAGQYTTGAKSAGTNQTSSQSYTDHTDKAPGTQSKFNTLIGWQPYMNWKLSDDISTTLAAGYYLWTDDSNTNNSRGGANATAIALNTASNKAPIAQYGFRIHNPKQWQVLSSWTLPYKLSATLEYVKNKKSILNEKSVTNNTYTTAATNPQPEVSSAAWAAGISWGKAAKAHDFSLGYTYGSKGIASVIGAFSNSSFLPDNKGHIVKAVYALADNFTFTWKGYFTKEKEKIDGANGKSYGVSNANNSNQNQSIKYWELIAGVSF